VGLLALDCAASVRRSVNRIDVCCPGPNERHICAADNIFESADPAGWRHLWTSARKFGTKMKRRHRSLGESAS